MFALEHYNPLNMIRAFGENGINPVYISVKRRYEVACRSKYISKLHRVDSVEEGYKLLTDEYVDMSEAVARADNLRQDRTEPEDYPGQEVF